MARISRFFYLFTLFVLNTKYSLAINDPVLPNTVRISSGLVHGKEITSRGVTGVVFRGIPTAENPTGPLRFHKAVLRRPWKGVFNATSYTVACPWNSTVTSTVPQNYAMDEDCLQTNVFTNDYCINNGGCAVVVYIHGGKFAYGSAAQFPVEILIENFANNSRNIVFLIPQFRLSVLGMLNLNHKLDLNMDERIGYEDIVYAIEWTKREVHAFGGNPNRITLFGHSAGGQIVSVLMADPRVNGFVRQFVAMSGSYIVQYADQNEAESRVIAQIVGCTRLDETDELWDNATVVNDVIACLRNKTAKELSDAQSAAEQQQFYMQGQAIDDGVYREMLTTSMLNNRTFRLLTGTVSRERLNGKDTVVDGVYVDQQALTVWCKKALITEQYCDREEELMNACFEEYNRTSRSLYIDDDFVFFVPTERGAASLAEYGKEVYLYEFTYQGIGAAFHQGPNKPAYNFDEEPHHAQDLVYVTGLHAGNLTAKDRQIQFLYSQYFANFINNGTPGAEWKRFDTAKGNYFKIDFPDPTLKSPGNTPGYHYEAVEFFDTILPSIADTCNDTTAAKIQHLLDDIPVPATHQHPQDFGNLNWMIMFWIGAGIIVLLAVSHAITCKKLKSKKSEYQYI